MPKEIRLGEQSRLIHGTDLRLAHSRGAPIDFAKDHILILDEDSRPVAECWPIERDGQEPARPVVVAPVAKPGPKLATFNGSGDPARNGLSAMATGGRLTEAHRELITRIWMENPKATIDHIGEIFERKAQRTISALTVASYKPDAGKAKV